MPIPTSLSPQSQVLTRRPLLRDDVYSRLRDAIVDGTLVPGEQVKDVDVAHWLGVSRTPVREALLRLGKMGLVESSPGRSTVICAIDQRATRNAQAVVAAMHAVVAEAAIGRLTESDLATMASVNVQFEAAVRADDVDAALAADDAFHAVPIGVAGNDAAATVLEQYEPLLRRVERLRFGSADALAAVARHTALIEAFRSQDLDAALQITAMTWRTLLTST